ncbi:DUF2442 domain-containing protein [Synechocystis sp. LEGE 06083]|uniref:DUF2442 domain-containing protein n=1 Tax=Synechocystis sp. LEGE 06083 TaxID=915336 RepID=UPI00187E48EC|nr:DUF2442 domain-containing protein [Synechocystis sp. LEGE 06083]MBE9196420.1 DUF2442 domain-containing protein [Synechocystis sp. LEGE 06083]
MNFSTIEILDTLLIQKVTITDEVLSVDLSDGRSISVSLLWYSRLLHGSQEECQDYRLIAGGMDIHWNQLEVVLKNLVLGQSSGESRRSLKRWLGDRLLGSSNC